MLNMMDDEKKTAMLILAGGDSKKDEKKEGSSYPEKVAGKLISAVKEGNQKEVVSLFKEMMSCCGHEGSPSDMDD